MDKFGKSTAQEVVWAVALLEDLMDETDVQNQTYLTKELEHTLRSLHLREVEGAKRLAKSFLGYDPEDLQYEAPRRAKIGP